jgi:hypothetical protein
MMAKKLGLGFAGLALLTLVLAPKAHAANTSFNLTTSPVSEVLTSKPGTNATTTLHVENNSSEPITLTIKMFTFGAAGTSGRPALRLASPADIFVGWAHFSPSVFVAQPGVPVAVTMTIDIPKTASLGYNYGVAFEPLTPNTVSGNGTAINGTNVVLVLLDTTSGNEAHSIQVANFTANKKLYEYLPVTFSVNIHNNGNIFLAPGGDIFVSKDSSFSPGSIVDTIPVNVSQGNILPNTNRIFQAQWTDGFPVYVPSEVSGHEVTKNNKLVLSLKWNFSEANKLRIGKYYAKLIMSYNNGQRQVPVTAVLSFWVLPWKLMLILILLVLTFIGLVVGIIYLIHRVRKLNRAVYKGHVRN